MSLHLTKTRLSLLRQVSERRVLLDHHSGESYVGSREGGCTKVTSRILELDDAKLVWLVAGGVVWRLTEAGRKALDGAS